MKIGIMGAMLEEVSALLQTMQLTTKISVAERDYYSGKLDNIDSTIVFSRWGKVAAATTATMLINHFKSDLIIFTGVAGAISKQLNIGDIVISKNLVQHDMDARPLTSKFEIPLFGKCYLEADQKLRSVATKASNKFIQEKMHEIFSHETLSSFGINNPKVYEGTIATGDQFINDPKKAAELSSQVENCLAVEMEGAAVAQVCAEHNVPFIVLRTISDKADHSAAIDFSKFVSSIAAPYAQGIIQHMLAELKDW